MNICSEHGDEIAYYGKDCPACEEIVDLRRDHLDEMEHMRGIIELQDEQDNN